MGPFWPAREHYRKGEVRVVQWQREAPCHFHLSLRLFVPFWQAHFHLCGMNGAHCFTTVAKVIRSTAVIGLVISLFDWSVHSILLSVAAAKNSLNYWRLWILNLIDGYLRFIWVVYFRITRSRSQTMPLLPPTPDQPHSPPRSQVPRNGLTLSLSLSSCALSRCLTGERVLLLRRPLLFQVPLSTCHTFTPSLAHSRYSPLLLIDLRSTVLLFILVACAFSFKSISLP